MAYEWEGLVKAYMSELQDVLPDNFQIVGVAVENVEFGEGALVERNSLAAEFADVTEADVRQDILGDAKQQYDRVYRAVFDGPKDNRKIT